jgi:hypothetical protein
MIFLAIAGMMFLIAALAVNGKQSQADFAVSIRDFRSKLDDVINDVSTGFYPDEGNFICHYTGDLPGNIIDITFGTGSKGQASHEDCIFLGKVVQFDTNGASNYEVITVAGGRLKNATEPSASIQDAKPKAAYGMTSHESLDGGLVVTRVVITDNSGTSTDMSAFGIFTDFSRNSSGLVSGTISTNLTSLPASAPGDGEPDAYNKIPTMIDTPYVTNPTIGICVGQGGSGGPTDRRAAIIIGSDNRQITTELHISDINTAAVKSLTGGLCP